MSKKLTNETVNNNEGINLKGISPTEYFDERYVIEKINPEMLDSGLKMIKSYFTDNKIEQKIKNPINHPINLDQVDREGFGFVLYCNAFQLDEQKATLFLAYSFSDFLIKNYGFKLYKDLKPEYPLRGMTLKYDKNGTFLSLYPYEYSSKVLNGSESFEEFVGRINSQIKELPKLNEEIQKFINPEDESQ